jgi:signal peptidase II
VRSRNAWILAGLVLVAVVVVDQLTKHLIADSIMPGQARHVLPGLQFVHTYNDGVAFGVAAGGHTVVIALIGLALLGVLLYFARHSTRRLVWLPTGLLLGGALSNILDRVRDGSVTDFIKLPLGWPPFNVADAAITVGVVLLALVIESGARGKAATPSPDGAPPRRLRRPRLRSSE